MTNPAWGTKRTCHNCTCKYYDLGRMPIICPRCSTEFDASIGQRLRSDPNFRPFRGRAKSVFATAAAVDGPEIAHEVSSEEETEKPDADEFEAEAEERDEEEVPELGDDDDEDLAEIAPHEEEV